MRLIDADSFELNVQSEWERAEISNGDWMLIRQLINEEPTIDAVEVVRCRDCKYSEVLGKSLIRYCDHSIIPMIRDDDGYCSCGERRGQ